MLYQALRYPFRGRGWFGRILILVLVCVGCSYAKQTSLNTNILDRVDILDHHKSSCFAGCWQDLRPGYSSADQVVILYDTLFGSYKTYSIREGYVNYTGRHPQDEYTVDAFVKDDRLVSIALSSSTSFNLTAEAIVQTLGTPIMTVRSGGIHPASGYISGSLLMLYPDEGLIFAIDLWVEDKSVCLDKRSTATAIYIGKTSSLEDLLTAYSVARTMNTDALSISVLTSQVIPWSGYECIQL